MLPYWFILVIPMIGVLGALLDVRQVRVWGAGCVAFSVVLIVMIGFRDHTGGDWYNYDRLFAIYRSKDFVDTISGEDPGYYVLNWLFNDVVWVLQRFVDSVATKIIIYFKRVA